MCKPGINLTSSKHGDLTLEDIQVVKRTLPVAHVALIPLWKST